MAPLSGLNRYAECLGMVYDWRDQYIHTVGPEISLCSIMKRETKFGDNYSNKLSPHSCVTYCTDLTKVRGVSRKFWVLGCEVVRRVETIID